MARISPSMSRSLCLALLLISLPLLAGAPPRAEHGRTLLTERGFNPPIWSLRAYDQVWKQWGLLSKPGDFSDRLMERYGLHPPPYENSGYPMGLREVQGLLGKGVGNDCLLCHGGSIFGKSYIGLGNASLDMQALYDELAAGSPLSRGTPFTFSNVRGTTEAGAMAVYLLQLRDENLNLQFPADLGYRTDLCEDAPAWWLLKKKKTIYHTGSTDQRSVRTLMQFAMVPTATADKIKGEEANFADLRAYILSLEPPKYPLAIDAELAGEGKKLFSANCARCHGTYGASWTYPNKIIDLDVIGTDRTRALGFSMKSKEHYDRSWLGQETDADGRVFRTRYNYGYQAPPLDGIWATAPYLHNGSVPTVHHVLNSKARPAIFTRSYRTAQEDYDTQRLGWRITELTEPPSADTSPLERRKIYDTTQPGRGNSGHTFGDHLSDQERRAIIEYLKTL